MRYLILMVLLVLLVVFVLVVVLLVFLMVVVIILVMVMIETGNNGLNMKMRKYDAFVYALVFFAMYAEMYCIFLSFWRKGFFCWCS